MFPADTNAGADNAEGVANRDADVHAPSLGDAASQGSITRLGLAAGHGIRDNVVAARYGVWLASDSERLAVSLLERLGDISLADRSARSVTWRNDIPITITHCHVHRTATTESVRSWVGAALGRRCTSSSAVVCAAAEERDKGVVDADRGTGSALGDEDVAAAVVFCGNDWGADDDLASAVQRWDVEEDG